MLALEGNPPFATSVIGIIGAVAGLVTAISLIITALAIFLPMYRQLKQVHTIVNQQQTDLRNYQVALISALKKGGIEVPVDQSAQGVPDGE
jgi:hypothetical protein